MEISCSLAYILFKTVEIPHYPIRQFSQPAADIRFGHRYTGVTQHPADGIQVRTSQIQVGGARLPGRMRGNELPLFAGYIFPGLI